MIRMILKFVMLVAVILISFVVYENRGSLLKSFSKSCDKAVKSVKAEAANKVKEFVEEADIVK